MTIIVDLKRRVGDTLQLLRPFMPLSGADRKLQQAVDDPALPGVGSRADGRRICMVVVSDLRVDPRVERGARTMVSAGYEVDVLCPDPTYGKNTGAVPDWGSGINITYLPWKTALFASFYPGFIAGQLFDAIVTRASRSPYFAIHAHDLNTCYAALGAARATGAHLIADFHEWSSENVHWDYRKKSYAPYPERWKLKLKDLEGRLMRDASGVITVSQSIVDALAAELGNGRRATLIRNIPLFHAVPTQDYPTLKAQLKISDDRFLLLWQGGTGPTRLIEPIIEALVYAPRCTLLVRGPSLDSYGDGYRAIAQRAGVFDRLILQRQVPSQDVVAAARGADAGIWTLPELCRNFTFAMPNKIFEYLASGLPVIVANYPEASQFVVRYDIGQSFDPYDPISIAAAINRLIDDPILAARQQSNIAAALADLNAEREWQKLVDLYDALPR